MLHKINERWPVYIGPLLLTCSLARRMSPVSSKVCHHESQLITHPIVLIRAHMNIFSAIKSLFAFHTAWNYTQHLLTIDMSSRCKRCHAAAALQSSLTQTPSWTVEWHCLDTQTFSFSDLTLPWEFFYPPIFLNSGPCAIASGVSWLLPHASLPKCYLDKVHPVLLSPYYNFFSSAPQISHAHCTRIAELHCR